MWTGMRVYTTSPIWTVNAHEVRIAKGWMRKHVSSIVTSQVFRNLLRILRTPSGLTGLGVFVENLLWGTVQFFITPAGSLQAFVTTIIGRTIAGKHVQFFFGPTYPASCVDRKLRSALRTRAYKQYQQNNYNIFFLNLLNKD